MKTMESQAYQLLEKHWGQTAFRAHQLDIILALTSGQDVSAMLPTGAGKSLCFQIAGLLMGGYTLVITPLLSLMEDQIQQLQIRRIPAVTLNSTQPASATKRIWQQLRSQRVRFLYISPEQLASEALTTFLKQYPPALLIIDEAHCISIWGHDFRPAYRRIAQCFSLFAKRPTIGAFTATAPPDIAQDITTQLKLVSPLLIKTKPLREQVSIHVQKCWTPLGKWQQLKNLLVSDKNLIYANNRTQIKELQQQLQHAFPDRHVLAYHAGLTPIIRHQAYQTFKSVPDAIMVASQAFGMGVDIKDIQRVIHWVLAESPVSYIQQVGRVARQQGMQGKAILLYLRTLFPHNHWLTPYQVNRELLLAFWKGFQNQTSDLRVQDTLNLHPTTLCLLLGQLMEYGMLKALRSHEYIQTQPQLDRSVQQAILQQIHHLKKYCARQYIWMLNYARKDSGHRKMIEEYFL